MHVRPDEFTRAAREAARSHDAVVAAGGDGTVSSVAAGPRRRRHAARRAALRHPQPLRQGPRRAARARGRGGGHRRRERPARRRRRGQRPHLRQQLVDRRLPAGGRPSASGCRSSTATASGVAMARASADRLQAPAGADGGAAGRRRAGRAAHADRVRRQQRVRRRDAPAGPAARASTTAACASTPSRAEAAPPRAAAGRCAGCSGGCTPRTALEARLVGRARGARRPPRAAGRASTARCCASTPPLRYRSGRGALPVLAPPTPTAADVSADAPSRTSRTCTSGASTTRSRRRCWTTWRRSRRRWWSSRGDLTQRARRAPVPRRARASSTGCRRPYLVVPGNHDIPLYDVVRRVFKPLDRYRDMITGDLAPTFLDDGLAVLGLNTARAERVEGGPHLAGADRRSSAGSARSTARACACW